jgi:hypothetical protein
VERDADQATRFLVAAAALRATSGAAVFPADRAAHEAAVAAARRALGDVAFASTWAAGEVTPQAVMTAVAIERIGIGADGAISRPSASNPGEPSARHRAGARPTPSEREDRRGRDRV